MTTQAPTMYSKAHKIGQVERKKYSFNKKSTNDLSGFEEGLDGWTRRFPLTGVGLACVYTWIDICNRHVYIDILVTMNPVYSRCTVVAYDR